MTKRIPLMMAALILGGCVVAVGGLSSCGGGEAAAPVVKIQIVGEYVGDPDAFVQGFLVEGERAWISTGLQGKSRIFRQTLEKASETSTKPTIEKVAPLEAKYFGEGMTRWKDKLITLTYQAKKGFVYDPETLRRERSFDLEGEGWGLTHDGTHLIMSDGSAFLMFLDPETFKVVDRRKVVDGEKAQERLNELEFIDGKVWANVWQTNEIVRIDPASGKIELRVDCSQLRGRAGLVGQAGEKVLNGIAWDAKARRLFLTGKNWPRIFEVALPTAP